MFSASFEHKMFKCVYQYQFQVYGGTDTFSKESSPAFYLWGQLPLSGEYWLILESLHFFVSWPVLKGKVCSYISTLVPPKAKLLFTGRQWFQPQVLNSSLYETLVCFFGALPGLERLANEIRELMIIFVSLSGTNSSNQSQSVLASFALLMCQWWQKVFLLSLKLLADWQTTPQQVFQKEKKPQKFLATEAVTSVPAEVRGALHFYTTA